MKFTNFLGLAVFSIFQLVVAEANKDSEPVVECRRGPCGKKGLTGFTGPRGFTGPIGDKGPAGDSSGPFVPAYANVLSFSTAAAIPVGSNIPLDLEQIISNAGADFTLDPDAFTLTVNQAGTYTVNYQVNTLLDGQETDVALFNGETEVPASRYGSAMSYQYVTGQTLVYLPAGSVLSLRNVGPDTFGLKPMPVDVFDTVNVSLMLVRVNIGALTSGTITPP